MRVSSWRAAVLTGALVLAACGSSSSEGVSISPPSASLGPDVTQQFTATVTGETDTSVTWSVQEGIPGGQITSGGLYTAPSTGGTTFHVVATSNADPTKSAVAPVAVSF
jgi:chitinase